MAEVALLATGLAAEVAPVVAAPAILAVAVAVAVAHDAGTVQATRRNRSRR